MGPLLAIIGWRLTPHRQDRDGRLVEWFMMVVWISRSRRRRGLDGEIDDGSILPAINYFRFRTRARSATDDQFNMQIIVAPPGDVGTGVGLKRADPV